MNYPTLCLSVWLFGKRGATNTHDDGFSYAQSGLVKVYRASTAGRAHVVARARLSALLEPGA